MVTPVYIKIHDDLKKMIENGEWKIGDKIPSERELCLKFNVSRMTLRQAVQTLAEEGILERKVGSGTFVARQKVQEKVSGVTSFTELMQKFGKIPSSKTISYHLADASSSEMEQLKLTDKRVLRMERVRYGNEEPICFEVATIPARFVRDLSKDKVTKSFYKTLEDEEHLKIGHAQQIVSAITASERVAEYLNLKRNDPLLYLQQVTCLDDGTPFEYVRTQYAGNRFEFYLTR